MIQYLCEWNYSGSQLRSNPKIIPERSIDDDDNENEKFIYFEV